MHITILASGSRGDVQPFVAVGAGLRRAGHHVRLAAPRNFGGVIGERGLDFFPLSGDIRQMLESEEGRRLLESGGNPIKVFRQLARMIEPVAVQFFRDASQACADTDGIVCASGMLFVGEALVEKRPRPILYGSLQPMAPTRHQASCMTPALPRALAWLGPWGYNRLTHALSLQLFWQMFRRPVNRARQLTLKCIHIPAGKFLMGTPVYMWPYHVEEYPHQVTLTRDYYLAEIPITQEMYEAVTGKNPSLVKNPQLPVQNPTFKDVEKCCDILSRTNGKKVRLPTTAEWEYAARVGTSSPAFAEKYQDQNSSGPAGFKSPLPVKSKKANAWGLYDMASSWWEITGDKAMYHVRTSVVDPHYPPGVENARSQRTGRGIVSDRWSIGTHEFITEKADYAGQKFRVVVEIEAKDAPQ
jgi:formylglycine-generating enzyme required for sulfatase activity